MSIELATKHVNKKNLLLTSNMVIDWGILCRLKCGESIASRFPKGSFMIQLPVHRRTGYM